MSKNEVMFKSGGQYIVGYTHRKFLFFTEIDYTTEIYRDGQFVRTERRVRWFPNWRIIPWNSSTTMRQTD